MNIKTLLQFVHGMSPESCREMGEILIAIADDGPRDAAAEAEIQAFINTFPDPQEEISA